MTKDTVVKPKPKPEKIHVWDEAWAQVMKMAEREGMISEAAGGTAILIHPEVQHEAGIRIQLLRMASRTEAEAKQRFLEEIEVDCD